MSLFSRFYGIRSLSLTSEHCLSDIYVCVVSFAHNVAKKGFYLAIVSTTVETSNPEAELKPGLDILGTVEEKYVWT